MFPPSPPDLWWAYYATVKISSLPLVDRCPSSDVRATSCSCVGGAQGASLVFVLLEFMLLLLRHWYLYQSIAWIMTTNPSKYRGLNSWLELVIIFNAFKYHKQPLDPLFHLPLHLTISPIMRKMKHLMNTLLNKKIFILRYKKNN